MALESKTSRLQDPGAKLLDGLVSFWTRYGRVVLIAVGVAAVVVVGVVLTLRSRAAAEEQAAGRLAEASIFFWQGDYPRSLQMARQVAEQWPGAPSGIDAHRLAGDDQYWMGNFKEASAEYRRYLESRKTGILADAVRRSLASSLESERRFKEAADTYEGLVGVFDRTTSAVFLLSAARCYAELHQPREADRRIQRLLDEYGDTPSANRARILRAELAAAPR